MMTESLRFHDKRKRRDVKKFRENTNVICRCFIGVKIIRHISVQILSHFETDAGTNHFAINLHIHVVAVQNG